MKVWLMFLIRYSVALTNPLWTDASVVLQANYQSNYVSGFFTLFIVVAIGWASPVILVPGNP